MANEEDTLGNVTAPELFRRVLEAHTRTLRTATPGAIQEYRRTGGQKNTADVIQTVLPDGEDQPVLSHVPVLVLGGGDGYLIFPYEKDDTGLVVFADSEIGTWRTTGERRAPADEARLSSSGPVIIPGLRTTDDAIEVAAGATVLAGSDVRLGSKTATKAAVHEDLLSGLDNFLAALDTWGQAIQVATGVPWAGPQGFLITIRNAIAAGSYESPSVSVED